MNVKSRNTRNTLTAIAASIALALLSTTPAFAAPTQTTGTGGYTAVCDAGTNPTTGGVPIPCPATTSSNADAAQATGGQSVAVGAVALSSGQSAVAVGTGALATGNESTALGFQANALTGNSLAIGSDAVANGGTSGGGEIAIGNFAQAVGPQSMSLGTGSYSGGAQAIALGGSSFALGAQSDSIGYGSQADGSSSLALGSYAAAVANGSTALGVDAGVASAATDSIAVGAFAQAYDPNTVAVGGGPINSPLTVGGVTYTPTSNNATVVGVGATVASDNSLALGYGAEVFYNSPNSIALGAGSYADQAGTVSVGSDGANGGPAAFTRRIVNVGAGINATDAVNVGQLMTVGNFANWIGGGTTWDPITGVFTAPTFQVQGANYSTVYGAIEALNVGVTTALSKSGTPGPQGPAGPQGPQGNTGPQGPQGQNAPSGPGSDTSAVHYDTASNGSIDYQSVTLLGAGGTQIHNLSAGTAPTDAANVSQVQQAETTAINTSESYSTNYTNSQIAPLNGQISALGLAVSQLSNRLDGLGAAEQASAQMAMACSGDRNCLSAGFGMQSGQGAVSLGFRHQVFRGRAAWTVGVSSSDAGTSVGAGFSINLH